MIVLGQRPRSLVPLSNHYNKSASNIDYIQCIHRFPGNLLSECLLNLSSLFERDIISPHKASSRSSGPYCDERLLTQRNLEISPLISTPERTRVKNSRLPNSDYIINYYYHSFS